MYENFAQTYKWKGMKPTGAVLGPENECLVLKTFCAGSCPKALVIFYRFLQNVYFNFDQVIGATVTITRFKSRNWMSSRTRSAPFMHSGMRKY